MIISADMARSLWEHDKILLNRISEGGDLEIRETKTEEGLVLRPLRIYFYLDGSKWNFVVEFSEEHSIILKAKCQERPNKPAKPSILDEDWKPGATTAVFDGKGNSIANTCWLNDGGGEYNFQKEIAAAPDMARALRLISDKIGLIPEKTGTRYIFALTDEEYEAMQDAIDKIGILKEG